MSGPYRPPAPKSASKASASTLCQKCLKRDIYECTSIAQERPYRARPSRTQQLLNPKLVPKLTTDVPNDLLRKKGIADETLAAAAAERVRNRSVDAEQSFRRKQSRSMSSASTSSVSTISTHASRSRSPPRRTTRPSPPADEYMTSQLEPDEPPVVVSSSAGKKRRRSTSPRYTSDESYTHPDRNTRRRRQSTSPDVRGRKRGRSNQGRRPVSRSPSAHVHDYSGENNRRRASKSPMPRAKDDRSHTPRAKDRKARSRSPFASNRRRVRSRSPRRRGDDHDSRRQHAPSQRAPPPFKERSLSPFSKRLALTQAMGR